MWTRGKNIVIDPEILTKWFTNITPEYLLRKAHQPQLFLQQGTQKAILLVQEQAKTRNCVPVKPFSSCKKMETADSGAEALLLSGLDDPLLIAISIHAIEKHKESLKERCNQCRRERFRKTGKSAQSTQTSNYGLNTALGTCCIFQTTHQVISL